MEVERPNPRAHPWVRAVVVLGVLVVLAAACVIGFASDDNHGEGVIIGATIGTALGTLALAGMTYMLATATRETVQEAGAELLELKAQRVLLAKQAESAAQQAESTGRLADASKAGAEAAEKARIDAIAPLIQCVVTIVGVDVKNAAQQFQPFGDDVQWYSAELEHLRFSLTLKFVLTNVGRGPAQVTFGDTSCFLERVQREKLQGIELQPGGVYVDHYVVNLRGGQTTTGEFVKMPFTYAGILHGELFDRVQWNGWVTPLTEIEPGVAAKHDRMLNSSGAQVIRTYPNLERPDEMADVRRRILE